MDDLFGVFDEGGQSSSKQDTPGRAGNKRRRNNDPPKGTNGNGVEPGTPGKRQRRNAPDSDDSSDSEPDVDGGENPGARSAKKMQEPEEPRVADEFETQETREVAASAGLQQQKNDENVILQHQVRHQVSLPPDYNYVPLSQHKPPAEPARTWPFPLDPFQQVSVHSIQRNESVLVSAHTSAGKTVVAEYAIAQCLKNNQRVIYTSPIKALSNQKFRDFSGLFGDVGLMTGDVTINPEATCLVMTTEILRSMLYRGSEVLREIAWVVFDEVHYLRDKARGVVWEETIILLPDKVRYVFLSATIPNAMQFADWITKIHNQPCHVVYTDFRPTPLQHYLFPAGSDGIHLVVDEKSVFREENFSKAMATLAEKQGDDPADANARRKGRGRDKKFNKGGQQSGQSDIYKIVKMIMTKNFNPVIVFSFSRRECEAHALRTSGMHLNSEDEKAMIRKIYNGAIETLSDEDKQLSQITNMLPLLSSGVGVHHSGLLPILKEIIEILFSEGLLKVLFATETFSIGLNMPAKTVVFTNVRKFDGVETRWVTSSEFIQMSGRAGRRGIDERGIVIMMIDQRMEPDIAKGIVRGEQDKLNSAFHLTYNMVLNLLRVEGIDPNFMLDNCFHQFQNVASLSGLQKQLHQAEAEESGFTIADEPAIKEYYTLRKTIDNYAKEMKAVITHPAHALPFMQPGRLVRIRFEDYDFGWAVVVQHKKRFQPRNKNAPGGQKPQQQHLLEVCMMVGSGFSGRVLDPDLPEGIRPPIQGEKVVMRVCEVLLSCVDSIGSFRLYMPDNLDNQAALDSVKSSLDEVKRRFPNGISMLDPVENMNIKDDSFKKLVKKIGALENKVHTNQLHASPQLPELYNQYSKKVELQASVTTLKRKINDAMSNMLKEELKNRKRVLRRLGFINDNDVVEIKGRIACHISTGDELMLSELLFNRFFNEMTPQTCAAALSCFVFEESKQGQQIKQDYLKMVSDIRAQARAIAKVSNDSKVVVKEEEYVQGFNPGLMDVVHAWTSGASFAEIWYVLLLFALFRWLTVSPQQKDGRL